MLMGTSLKILIKTITYNHTGEVLLRPLTLTLSPPEGGERG
jgi:hypothetical protein